MYDPRENDKAAALEVADKDKADEDCRDRSSSGGDPAPENNSDHYDLEAEDKKCDTVAWIIRALQLLAIVALGAWVFFKIEKVSSEIPTDTTLPGKDVPMSPTQIKDMIQEHTRSTVEEVNNIRQTIGSLQTKLDPLNSRINDLSNQVTNLDTTPVAPRTGGGEEKVQTDLTDIMERIEALIDSNKFGKSSAIFNRWMKAEKNVHVGLGTRDIDFDRIYYSCNIDYSKEKDIAWNGHCNLDTICGFCQCWRNCVQNDFNDKTKVKFQGSQKPYPGGYTYDGGKTKMEYQVNYKQKWLLQPKRYGGLYVEYPGCSHILSTYCSWRNGTQSSR